MEDSISFKIAKAVSEIIRAVVFNGEFNIKGDPTAKVSKVLFGHKIGNIVVAGSEVRLIFKVHYTDNLGEYFLGKYMNAKEINSQKVDDFFLETCNLSAGRIKHGLLDENSSLGISIPIKTKGFDDLFFTLSTDGEFCSEWHWDLVNNENVEVHFSLFIEVLNSDLKIIEQNNSNTVDELEFF